MRIVAFFSAIVVTILLLTGCGHEKSNNSPVARFIQLGGIEYPEFPKNSVIQLKKSDFPKGEIRSIQKIPLDLMIENREIELFIKGDYLIIKHLEMREGAYLLHVVSLLDYKVIAQLAPFGEGPNEFMDIRVIPTKETDKLCYIWNIYNNQLFTLSTAFELEEYDQLYEIQGNRVLFGAPLYIGDGKMQVTLGSNNGMGIGWGSVNDSTVKGTVPFHFAKDASGFFYMGQLGYSFFRKREAFAFLYHDRIAFFDFDGNHVKMCQFGDKTLRTTSSPDNPICYYSCFASDKYVYATYRESENDKDDTNPLYLEQFDWDGNPVARYSLPKGRGLYTGCVTEDNSIIYMVDYYEDNFLHKIVLSKD